MPRPVAFTRNQNYTDWQTAHPGQPLPGTDVDSEFNEVAKTTLDLVDFTRFIQRDDGSLLDGVVGTAQLDPTAFDDLLQPQIDQAAASAAAAAGSASQAASSASQAATSQVAAAGSASTAATSASTAQGAATAAGTSATNAANSATAAGTSATNAAGSATASANSATASQTSAQASQTSANAASASATQAAANINAHASLTNNPHNVTAAQVGAPVAQWNAAYIQNKPVSATNPAPGQILLWDAALGQIVWGIPSIPSGASYVPPVAAGDVGNVLTATGAPAGSAWLPAVDATARTTATNAQNTANTAQTTANNALPKAGGTMTGLIVLSGNAVANLNPVALQQLNTSLGAYLPLAGGTMAGSLLLAADPAQVLEAATKQYVDTTASTHSTMTLDYTFQTATTAPPNSGYVRLNNATQSAATTLWIHKIGAAGKDESLYLALLTQGSTVILQDRDDSTRVQVYTLSGPLVDSGAYDTVPVVWKSGNAPLVAQRILVTLAVGAASGGVTVGDTAPASPADGSMWFDSVGLQLYLRYNDGNSAQWVPTINQINGGAPLASPAFTGNPTAPTPPAGDADTSISTTAFVAAAVAPALNDAGRNLLHNGTFAVQQRGQAFATNGAYTVDRWLLNFNLDTGINVSAIGATDGIRTQIGDESALWSLNTTVVGNAGAAAFTLVAQKIEDVRRLGGKTVVLSFWAWCAAGTPKLGASIDQQFGSGGSPSVAVTGNGQAVTLSTTGTRYSLTFAVPSVSGKTVGTNGDSCTALNFWYSSGANQATRAGNIGVQSATIALWGVQLEIGTVATPLDYGGTPQQQLAACQRFYQTGQIINYGYIGGGMIFAAVRALMVSMRAAPTVTNGTPSTNTNLTSASISVAGTDAVQFVGTGVAAAQFAYANTYTASADL